MDLTVSGRRSNNLEADEMEDRVIGTSRTFRFVIRFVLKSLKTI
jgi:hypothetical protein